MTRLYHLTDNTLCKDLGIVSRYNVRAVLCDEYDTTQPGVMEAIEDIICHMCNASNDYGFGCDALNCTYSDTTIDEVEDMAIDEVRRGAYIVRAERMMGRPLQLVGFSWRCVRALQAVYCGYDVCTHTEMQDDGSVTISYDHFVESVGMHDDEVRVMNHIIGNQCRC